MVNNYKFLKNPTLVIMVSGVKLGTMSTREFNRISKSERIEKSSSPKLVLSGIQVRTSSTAHSFKRWTTVVKINTWYNIFKTLNGLFKK